MIFNKVLGSPAGGDVMRGKDNVLRPSEMVLETGPPERKFAWTQLQSNLNNFCGRTDQRLHEYIRTCADLVHCQCIASLGCKDGCNTRERTLIERPDEQWGVDKRMSLCLQGWRVVSVCSVLRVVLAASRIAGPTVSGTGRTLSPSGRTPSPSGHSRAPMSIDDAKRAAGY